MNTTLAVAIALWATTSAAIIAGAMALQYRRQRDEAEARSARASAALAAEHRHHAAALDQHSATLTRAAGHIERLAAIIQSQPDERAAVADLTEQTAAYRRRALEAMQDALWANLPRYAIRNPRLLQPRQPGRN